MKILVFITSYIHAYMVYKVTSHAYIPLSYPFYINNDKSGNLEEYVGVFGI